MWPSGSKRLLGFGKRVFKENLFLSNLVISFSLSGLGDIIQQKVERKGWNAGRTLQMSTSFGLTSGFLCHHWYNYLDRVLPGRGFGVVLRKIVWDQVVFSPVCIVACLLVAARIENTEYSTAVAQTVQLGGRLYLAEWVIWPPAQYINFTFLPTRFRVLYDNVISLLYDTYTSHVKNDIPLQEDFEENLVKSGWLPCHHKYAALLNDYPALKRMTSS